MVAVGLRPVCTFIWLLLLFSVVVAVYIFVKFFSVSIPRNFLPLFLEATTPPPRVLFETTIGKKSTLK